MYPPYNDALNSRTVTRDFLRRGAECCRALPGFCTGGGKSCASGKRVALTRGLMSSGALDACVRSTACAKRRDSGAGARARGEVTLTRTGTSNEPHIACVLRGAGVCGRDSAALACAMGDKGAIARASTSSETRDACVLSETGTTGCGGDARALRLVMRRVLFL